MPTTRAGDGEPATLSTNERFLDLLCADDELLRAEFDAIIAAEWPSPPPTAPHRGTTAGDALAGRGTAGKTATPQYRPDHPTST